MKPKMEIVGEDTVILAQGEINHELYKIVSGNAVMYRNYGMDNEYLIGILPQHRYFGETGFLTGEPSPYTVVANTEVLLMRIPEDEFEDFIVNNPKNITDIMKNMADNIVTLSKHIEMIFDELGADDKQEATSNIDLREKILKYKNFGMSGLGLGRNFDV